jgi:hypothetical protein
VLNVALWPILLKKSEHRLSPIFLASWVRLSDADAGASAF